MKFRDGQKPEKSFTGTLKQSIASFLYLVPMLFGIMLFIGLIKVFITSGMIKSFFTGYGLPDALIGSVFGSISAGNPITSYIISGELLKSGVSLFAVTAFILAWVTVGIVQFPAESEILGKKFAIQRNILSFLLSIAVAAATVYTLGVVG